MWTARRIMKELADADRRRKILTAFWKYGETNSRLMAQVQLARALRFREDTIRKLPPEKKAELTSARIGTPEFEQVLEIGLMAYHTHEQNAMLGAFLDQWQIPHVNGAIEVDDYDAPTADQVRDAVRALEGQYDRQDVLLYLASAGLLMGEDWAAVMWPAVDELSAAS
jgi:hypothetical protein